MAQLSIYIKLYLCVCVCLSQSVSPKQKTFNGACTLKHVFWSLRVDAHPLKHAHWNICTSQTQCCKGFFASHSNSGQSVELKVSLPSIAGGSQKYGIKKSCSMQSPPTNNFVEEKKLIHKVNNIMLGTIECPSNPTPCSSTSSCSTTTPILPGHPRPLAPFLRNSLHWDPIELWIPILQLSNLQLTIRKRPHGQVHNSFLQDTICT